MGKDKIKVDKKTLQWIVRLIEFNEVKFFGPNEWEKLQRLKKKWGLKEE